MSSTTTARWRRFGHDRLYVKAEDGTPIGWACLRTGAVEAPDAAAHIAVEQAVSSWRADEADESICVEPADPAPVPAPATPSVSSTAHAAVNVLPGACIAGWFDLALNRPGAGIREQAVKARQAAPVRTFIARVARVHTDERAWRVGADGEDLVAARLAKLDTEWRVLHSVPVGTCGADIDHVVIGPGGVFTINAKHHPGSRIWVKGDTFCVNGRARPYVVKARHEAQRASRVLTAAVGRPVPVMGVVVPVRADAFDVQEAPAGVGVVNRRHVERWLRQRPRLLVMEEVEAVFAMARRSTIWQPAGPRAL